MYAINKIILNIVLSESPVLRWGWGLLVKSQINIIIFREKLYLKQIKGFNSLNCYKRKVEITSNLCDNRFKLEMVTSNFR